MTAGIYNFTIEQGATLSEVFTWQGENGSAVNLSDYTARLQAKQSYSSPAAITLTTENGGIILGGTNGQITLYMSASDTSDLNVPNNLIYDLEMVSSGGQVTRLIQGGITVSSEVTT